MMNKHILLALLILCTISKGLTQTRLIKDEQSNSWHLTVEGERFPVKGLTFGPKPKAQTIGKYMKDLKFLGVNTIRTWGCGDETQLLLDSAHAYGIKVMLGLWLRHGRPGMEGDDSFDYINDEKGKKDMHAGIIAQVKKYKDHPAVLLWGVGNEVILNIATDKEKKVYAKYLEKLCKEIKSIDPEHPISSVSAWNISWKWWTEYVPSIDIYGVNSYGPGANNLSQMMTDLDIDKPYMITEFGATGEWDAPKDQNGIKIEPSDTEKYSTISDGYRDWIAKKSNCLGVYVFHYGSTKTFGSVWLTTHIEDKTRPQYWAVREAFTSSPPLNYVPNVEISIVKSTASTQEWIPVEVDQSDKDGDSLHLSFYYNHRVGSRNRRDQLIPLTSRKNALGQTEILTPYLTGTIKVYAFVEDQTKNLGIASTSLNISDASLDKDFIPGAYTKLPFTVYDEDEELPYAPTAYMGDIDFMKVDLASSVQPQTGIECLEINYSKSDGWYGFGMVDPPNDWGDKPGGYNWTGATEYSCWIRSDVPVKGKVGFGMIGDNQVYYDSYQGQKEVWFKKEWTKVTIDISDKDLSCIKTGLVVYMAGVGEPYSIYIDNVEVK